MTFLAKLPNLLLTTAIIFALNACDGKTSQEANTTSVPSVPTQQTQTPQTTPSSTANTPNAVQGNSGVNPTQNNPANTNQTDTISGSTSSESNADASSGSNVFNGSNGGNGSNGQNGGSSDNANNGTDDNATTNGDSNATTGGNDDNTATEGDNNTTTGGSSDNNTTNDTNTTQENNSIVSLTLTTPQTKFVRTKDSFYNDYLPISSTLKVIATYKDGTQEEVTDRVVWKNINGPIVIEGDRLRAENGTFKLQAQLNGIESNEIILHVKDDNQSIIAYETDYNHDFSAVDITIRLLQEPKENAWLYLRVAQPQKAGFKRHSDPKPTETATIVFEAQAWKKGIRSHTLSLYFKDRNNTDDIVVITEPIKNKYGNLDGKDPQDIVIPVMPDLILDAPSIRQRKGAVRGVLIRFEITTGNQWWSKVRLINPPKGMKAVGKVDYENTELYGITVQWDVPMDIEEGKTYDITAEATDNIGRKKTITFPIKVPKTTPVQTEIRNNELIVTDTNSPLYGMKLRGHNSEDISQVKIRSVKYEDVWRKAVVPKDPNDQIERIVFVIDNMPEAVDVKFPEWMDTYEERRKLDVGMYRTYIFGALIGSRAWNRDIRIKSVDYDGTNGLYIQERKDDSYENLFMITIAKAQNKKASK